MVLGKQFGGSGRIDARNAALRKRERETGIDTLDAKERKDLTKYIKENAKRLWACQHLIAISRRVPHPKYGDKVPHFETTYVPDPMQCSCEEAQRFRASLA